MIHLGAAALLATASLHGQHSRRESRPLQRQAVNLRALSSSEWSANRGASPAPTRRTHPAPSKREEVPKGQVVDVAPGNGQTSPEAKFLAETANTTPKQTRAKETTPFYGAAMPRTSTALPQKATAQDTVRAPQVKGNNGRGEENRARLEAGAVSGRAQTPNTQRRDALAMRSTDRSAQGVNLSGLLDRNTRWGASDRFSLGSRQQPTPASEDGSEGKQGSEGSDQLASPAALASRSGAAPNDHLEGVGEGDGTFLNTREWKYAGFFNRVKQAVSAHWKPNAVLEHRRIDDTRTRVTVVNVSLDERGQVKQMRVESSSGDSALDAEAVAAFERSQPFPNPPSSLIGADAAIHFSFGFYMEMNGTAQFRPFRFGN